MFSTPISTSLTLATRFTIPARPSISAVAGRFFGNDNPINTVEARRGDFHSPGRFWEHHEVNGAAVEGDKPGGFVEVGGGDIADIDGRLEAGGMATGELQALRAMAARPSPRPRARSQAKVDDFPDVAVGESERRRTTAVPGSPAPAQPPAVRDEPARGAVARDDVVERPDPSSSGMSRLEAYVAWRSWRNSSSWAGSKERQSSWGRIATCRRLAGGGRGT